MLWSNRIEPPPKRMSLNTTTSARPKVRIDEIRSFISSGTRQTFSPARTQKYSPRNSESRKKQAPLPGNGSRPQRWAIAAEGMASAAITNRAPVVRLAISDLPPLITTFSRGLPTVAQRVSAAQYLIGSCCTFDAGIMGVGAVRRDVEDGP